MVPGTKTTTPTGYLEAKENLDKNDNENKEKKHLHPTKESWPLQLGTYRGTVTPLLVLFFGYTCGLLATNGMPKDPRMAGLPFMDDSYTIVLICILYIVVSVVWGPNYMRYREPFKIRKIMAFYNAFQVVICTLMVVEVGLVGWFFDYNLYCQPVDFSWNDKPFRMTRVAYYFFLSKILDFVDTLFFIMNKKFTHISTLHVVHHSTMCMSMWAGIRFTAGGHLTFMGFINGMVHVIMYTYYLLAALGPEYKKFLWWKKYLTTIQLGQFVIVFIHSAQLLFHECPTVPRGLIIWTCIYACIFFYLFSDFYNKAYVKPDDKKKVAKLQNGFAKGHASGHANGYANSHANGHINGQLKSGHNLTFRIDSCLNQTTILE